VPWSEKRANDKGLPFLLFTGTSNSTHLNYVTGWSVKASDAMIENRIRKGFSYAR
jgi:hypothetical protein